MADYKIKNRLVVSGSEAIVNGQQVTTTANTQTLTNKSIDGSTNTLTNIPSSALASNIDAAKIADGSVSNAEFQYLDGVTSAIQTQLNAKALDSAVIKKDGSVAFTAAQSMGGNKITSLAAGTASSDAVNKGQMDAALEGLKPKAAVRVATTANIVIATALNSGDVIDGITLANGDRVLVKDQTSAETNGIYVVSATPIRSVDFDQLSPSDEINGSLVAVQEGTTHAGKVFVQSGTVATLNTDPINFVLFNSVATLVGGDGVTISGTNISVDHDGQGLDFVTGQLALELDGTTLTKAAAGLKVSDATLNAKANTTLNNLGVTNINNNLLFDTANAYDIGSTTKSAGSVFLGSLFSNGTMNIIARLSALMNFTAAAFNFSNSNGTTGASLKIYTGGDAQSIALTAPTSIAASVDYTLPGAPTVSNQVLSSTTGGVMSWVTPASAYTNEQAQDAVGNILTDSSKIDFTYDDAANTITATIVPASLVNADINASAAISLTKLAATTVSRALVSDASGFVSPSAVTATELGYVSGVTSAIQTQLNAKVASVSGDIVPTTFSTANNQAAAANVTGLAFANATTRSFKVLMDVQIDATSDLYEVYELLGVQKSASWDMSQSSTGDDAGLVFTITNAGQIQYTSTNVSGFVSGSLKFRASTIPVA